MLTPFTDNTEVSQTRPPYKASSVSEISMTHAE